MRVRGGSMSCDAASISSMQREGLPAGESGTQVKLHDNNLGQVSLFLKKVIGSPVTSMSRPLPACTAAARAPGGNYSTRVGQ